MGAKTDVFCSGGYPAIKTWFAGKSTSSMVLYGPLWEKIDGSDDFLMDEPPYNYYKKEIQLAMFDTEAYPSSRVPVFWLVKSPLPEGRVYSVMHIIAINHRDWPLPTVYL